MKASYLTHINQKKGVIQNIIVCLKCPILLSNLANNPALSGFLSAVRSIFMGLQQKMDCNQMILNKQKFFLESIQRQTEENKLEQIEHEKNLKKRITNYEYLLAKRDMYLNTLQKLSGIFKNISRPDKIWENASKIMLNEILDLEAVGLIILENTNYDKGRSYTDLLPQRLSAFIKECLDHEDYNSRLMDTEVFISLDQIYWDSVDNPKRPGPRTEEMMERCLLFPIKDNLLLIGVFIVFMKNLTSSYKDLGLFFSTAARLIEEGILANSLQA